MAALVALLIVKVVSIWSSLGLELLHSRRPVADTLDFLNPTLP